MKIPSAFEYAGCRIEFNSLGGIRVVVDGREDLAGIEVLLPLVEYLAPVDWSNLGETGIRERGCSAFTVGWHYNGYSDGSVEWVSRVKRLVRDLERGRDGRNPARGVRARWRRV